MIGFPRAFLQARSSASICRSISSRWLEEEKNNSQLPNQTIIYISTSQEQRNVAKRCARKTMKVQGGQNRRTMNLKWLDALFVQGRRRNNQFMMVEKRKRQRRVQRRVYSQKEKTVKIFGLSLPYLSMALSHKSFQVQ